MPRQARIDAPGAFHHITCRGLERRKIFLDDIDRDSFVSRLGQILEKTSTRCFAWALIPNHFHLLLQTGSIPLATVMRRLMTGHAVFFNRRHKRVGHVFLNRYKSILCQMEPYLLELVRYIHLNPIRAKIVTSMEELPNYKYCGHGRLLGAEGYRWQETQEVLQRFGPELKAACGKYEAFVREGIAMGKRPDLTGGGLARSFGGWTNVLSTRRSGVLLRSDERILGDSDFVEMVLGASDEQLEKKIQYRREGVELEQAAQRVSDLLQLNVDEVWRPSKKPVMVWARSLLCYWATHELGIPGTEVGAKLGLTQSAVSRSVGRGAKLAEENGWRLR